MPINKRNNRKTVIKQAIKRRLIEISIRVDGYIYRNKPITVEEAEKYIHEISLHQTKCNNDKHILQVIEKLTRCMKTIIEDKTKKLSSHQKELTLENNISVDSFPESSLKNKHEDNNVILDNNCNQVTTEVLKERKNQKSNTADTIVISDSENEENADKTDTKFPIYKDVNAVTMEGSAIFNVNEKNNELKSCNFNTLHTEAYIITVNSMNENTNQFVQTSHDYDKNIKHLKPNETCCRNVVHKPKEIINDTCNLITVNNEIKRKCTKKITKKQTPAAGTNKKRTFKKKNTSGIVQNPLPFYPTLNLETAMNTNAQKIKIVSKKNKKRVSQKNVNNDLPNETHKRKKTTNKNNNSEKTNFKEHNIPSSSITAPLFCALNKFKHTHVDIIRNEVSLPMQRVINSEVPNQDSVTNQMGKLTIYNEHVLNDLSWIENIRYVREISTDEFDQTPNRFNEAFWDNCLLLNSWKDDDFLD